jgi:protein CpxP
MDKIKIFGWAVIALLFLNVSTLGFLIFSKSHVNNARNHTRPATIIIEKLHFDQNQQVEYQKLIQWHRSQINDFDQQIRNSKNELYLQLLQSEPNVKTKDSLIAVIANCQQQIENTHFKHFEDIKKLCNTDQLKDFDALTCELSKLFSGKPKPRHD